MGKKKKKYKTQKTTPKQQNQQNRKLIEFANGMKMGLVVSSNGHKLVAQTGADSWRENHWTTYLSVAMGKVRCFEARDVGHT